MSVPKILLVVCLLVGYGCTDPSYNPGVNLKVTNSGLELVKNVGIGWASEWLENYKFNNYGTDNFQFTNLNLESFTFGDVDLLTEAPNAIRITIDGAAMHLTGSLHWSWLFFSADADFSIQASNVGARLSLRMGPNSNGLPTIDIADDSCSANIGTLVPKVKKTGYDSLINLAMAAVSNPLAEWLSEQACPVLQKTLQWNSQKLFDQIPTRFPIPMVPLTFDVGLVQPVSVDANSISLSMKGVAYPNNDIGITFPFTPPPLAQSEGWAKGFYLVLSEYTLNTLLYSLTESGWLSGDFSADKNVPVPLPFSLTTKAFSNFIPGLANYTDSSMSVTIDSRGYPSVQLTENLMNITGSFAITVNLNGGNLEEPMEAFVVALDASLSGGVEVSGMNLTGFITDITAEFSEIRSQVGALRVDVFNKLVKVFVPQIKTQVNKWLETGIAIPTYKGFSSSDESVYIKEDAIEVAANIYQNEYLPPK